MIGNESGLVCFWNFEEGSGNNVYDLSPNGNNGIINSANFVSNTPLLNCGNYSGCDSVAIINLTINESDTSYTNLTACDSYTWNGVT